MKSTGVVRRIDQLGRIVIPKEIRKSLKIKDGDALEIFVEDDRIELQKSSTFKGLEETSGNLVAIIALVSDKNVLITDTNKILAANRDVVKEYIGKEITSNYLSILNKRDTFVTADSTTLEVVNGDTSEKYYLLVPIVVNGELLGSILLFSSDKSINDSDKMLIKFVVKFLEKSLED